jgi:hypothetical protein
VNKKRDKRKINQIDRKLQSQTCHVGAKFFHFNYPGRFFSNFGEFGQMR